MALLLLALSIVFGIAAAHPFITYPLSLWIMRKRNPVLLQQDIEAEKPTYAICVCAYNEEAVIRDKAENLRALKKNMPDLDVRVYVDCASDKTADILMDYKDDFFIHVADERHGKTYGMNLLVAGSSADIIVFTDANVMLDLESVSALDKYFSDTSVGCVCGHLIYVNEEDGATAATGSLYWKMEESIKQLESDTGSVMGADGSIFAVRRKLHTPPPADIIDDMYVSMNILCKGFRIVRAVDVKAYEKSVTSSDEEFRRKVRIACQAFNCHRLIWPDVKSLPALDLYKYISHKFVRWFLVLWIMLSGIFFTLFLFNVGFGWLAITAIIIICVVTWAGIRLKYAPVLKITDILTAIAGTGIGICKSIQGLRFQTWSPAMSIRKS